MALHTRTVTHLLDLACMSASATAEPRSTAQHRTALHRSSIVRIMNAVHADSNWRQRLRAEQASAGQWREQWGFLEVRTINNNR